MCSGVALLCWLMYCVCLLSSSYLLFHHFAIFVSLFSSLSFSLFPDESYSTLTSLFLHIFIFFLRTVFPFSLTVPVFYIIFHSHHISFLTPSLIITSALIASAFFSFLLFFNLQCPFFCVLCISFLNFLFPDQAFFYVISFLLFFFSFYWFLFSLL